jgi:hypothetical protein
MSPEPVALAILLVTLAVVVTVGFVRFVLGK